MSYKIPESVLVLIHAPDGDVLLIERADHPGFWQSVTGSKDTAQERPCETALRELEEETGLVAKGFAPQGSDPFSVAARGLLVDWQHHIEYEIFEHWRWRYGPGVTHNTEHWFSICVPKTSPIRLAEREHLQHRWLPWQAAADACFSWSNAQACKDLGARWLAQA